MSIELMGKEELGEKVGKKLLELEPNQSGRYVLLTNIYAASGKWDHVATLRRLMREKGFNKTPGCSFIDLGGTILLQGIILIVRVK